MRLAVVLLCLLGVAGCTASETKEPTAAGPSGPQPSASASGSAPPTKVDIRPYQNQDDGAIHFALPSGNILCDLASESDIDFLSCYIREHVWHIKDCPNQQGTELTIGIGDDEAAHIRCAQFPTNVNQYRVLPYGHVIKGINIACASATEGMSCEDERPPFGRFFLSRARYTLGVGRG